MAGAGKQNQPKSTPEQLAPLVAPANVKEENDTVRFVNNIVSEIEPNLAEIANAVPESLAGIDAYDEDKYKRALQQDGACECIMPVTYFSARGFTMGANYPCIGAIQRTRDSHVPRFSGDGAESNFAACRSWQTVALPVRVLSADCPPDLGKLVCLAFNELRLALFLALAQAVKAKDEHATREFVKLLSNVRVRFEVIADVDAFERRQWLYLLKNKQMSENMDLAGIRRSLQIVAVELMLSQRAGDSKIKPADVVAWFIPLAQSQGQGGQVDDDSGFSQRQIEHHLRIGKKMAPCVQVLLRMESVLGSKHGLCSLKSMDQLLICTSVGRQDAVGREFLKWAIAGVFVSILRGATAKTISGKELKSLINEWLLIRRLCKYLANKLTFAAKEGMVYLPGCAPGDILNSLFTEPLVLHNSYPRGIALPSEIAEHIGSVPQGHQTPLPPTLCDAINFLLGAIDRRSDIQAAIQKTLDGNPYVSAETFLAELDPDIFSMEAATHDLRLEESKAKALVEAEARLALETKKALEAQANAVLAAEVPAVPSAVSEPAQEECGHGGLVVSVVSVVSVAAFCVGVR